MIHFTSRVVELLDNSRTSCWTRDRHNEDMSSWKEASLKVMFHGSNLGNIKILWMKDHNLINEAKIHEFILIKCI